MAKNNKAQANFLAQAPGIMDRLMAEFPLWDEIDAAADLGTTIRMIFDGHSYRHCRQQPQDGRKLHHVGI